MHTLIYTHTNMHARRATHTNRVETVHKVNSL